MKHNFRYIIGIVAAMAALAVPASSFAWGGGAVTLVSCGEADVTLPAESGPWQYNIEQDGHLVLHGTSNGAAGKVLSIGIRAMDDNEHSILVWVSNAASKTDGYQSATATFVNCGPVTGTPGPQGPTGPEGPKGANGVGSPGPAGPKGDTGPAGPKGTDGAKGSTGTEGPAGKEGAKGLTGPIGPQGPTGPASEVPGPKGPAGPQGPAGPSGPLGPQGPEGPIGTTGLTGFTGTTGTQGIPGISGVAGPVGPQGTCCPCVVAPKKVAAPKHKKVKKHHYNPNAQPTETGRG